MERGVRGSEGCLSGWGTEFWEESRNLRFPRLEAKNGKKKSPEKKGSHRKPKMKKRLRRSDLEGVLND